MTAAIGHRVRWIAVWVAVALWFIGLAANVGGNGIHLLLVVAIALLLYELLAEDRA
jgi:hypothetical protein